MINIIIVDDHILFREGLRAIINLQPDFKVIALAGTVQESIDQVLAHRPDIVLMDFSLPDGSGVDATQTILAQYPQCKIIFLTMSEKETDLFAAVRSGAKGFISKGIPTSKLVAAIKAVQQGEGALSPSMTMRIMEELARTKQVDTKKDPRFAQLTAREMDVVKELGEGRTNQEIAQRLFLTENTVKYHVHSILTKLGLDGRKEVAYMALECGIVKNRDRVRQEETILQ